MNWGSIWGIHRSDISKKNVSDENEVARFTRRCNWLVWNSVSNTKSLECDSVQVWFQPPWTAKKKKKRNQEREWNLPAFQATRAATLLLRRRLSVLRSVRRRISLRRISTRRRIALRRVSRRRISILRITFRWIT